MTMLNGEPVDMPNISTTPSAPPPGGSFTADPTARLMGILALVMAFVFPLAGIVLGAIGVSMAKRTGSTNSIAKVGLVLSIVFTAIIVIVTVLVIVFSVGLFSEVFRVCQELGDGTHNYNGVTYNCAV